MKRAKRRMCHECRGYTLFERPPVPHVRHLVLTVLTLGLWGFAYAFAVVTQGLRRRRCRDCGNT